MSEPPDLAPAPRARTMESADSSRSVDSVGRHALVRLSVFRVPRIDVVLRRKGHGITHRFIAPAE
jgi:hypothetical protein